MRNEPPETLVKALAIRWTYPVAKGMGFAQGEIVLEVGYDADCDSALRKEIAATVGTKFVEGTATEVVDAVILWWRDTDGDLVDELVDALTYLTEDGPIWLFTPKVGRSGYVEPSDIQDAAPTAGMSQTTSLPAGADWTATRLVARSAGSSKKKSK